jgi:hypothetical protein
MHNDKLVQELLAMREVGIHVADATLQHAQTADLAEYQAINCEELASLFCDLYNNS